MGSRNSKEISMARTRVRVAGSLKSEDDSGFYSQHNLMHRKVLIREELWETVKNGIFQEFLMIGEDSHNVLLILTSQICN